MARSRTVNADVLSRTHWPWDQYVQDVAGFLKCASQQSLHPQGGVGQTTSVLGVFSNPATSFMPLMQHHVSFAQASTSHRSSVQSPLQNGALYPGSFQGHGVDARVPHIRQQHQPLVDRLSIKGQKPGYAIAGDGQSQHAPPQNGDG